MCWATALATFAFFFALSLLLVAGTDLTTLVLSGVLAGTALLHNWDGGVWLPWWWYASVASILALRLSYLAFLNRERLLVVQAWRKAKALAGSRCPNKPKK